jgi:SpoIID/LytB domain protein
MPLSAQRLESKRLDALLARHGWILLPLDTSTRSATITVPAGARLALDDKSVECVAGSIQASATGGGILINIPGQGGITVSEAVIAPTSGPFQFNGRSYRGRARLSASGGAIRVLNEIMIDDWLKGVLPAEIGSDSPIEALKAQAVAARSEAIFRLAHPPHKSDGYDFCTGVHCQAYKGISEETPEIRRACDETLGFVLVAEGDVVNAVYHNVCGGVTAAAEDVWDGGPVAGLTPVFDTVEGGSPNLQSEAAADAFIESGCPKCFCNPNSPGYANYAKKYFRWSKTLDAEAAGRAAGVGTLTGIEVTERRPSGRVRKLHVTGTAGNKTIEKELPIRNMFDLWSGLFVLKVDGVGGQIRSVTFVGAGNGHGVGLCQHGAREIARRGGRFDQILGHYYPTATLRKVYRP